MAEFFCRSPVKNRSLEHNLGEKQIVHGRPKFPRLYRISWLILVLLKVCIGWHQSSKHPIWKKKKEAGLVDSWLSCGCLQIMWFSWVQAINRLYEGRSDKRNVEIATIIALLLPPAPYLQFHFSNQNKFPMISWLRILISKGTQRFL